MIIRLSKPSIEGGSASPWGKPWPPPLPKLLGRLALAAIIAQLLVPAAKIAYGASQFPGSKATLRQVTSITQGEIWEPSISSQLADYITFSSDGDVMGPGTAPGHREVYLYDVAQNTIIAVTQSGGGESYGATRLCDDGPRGRYLAFISTADLDPDVGNADGNPELFFWHLATGKTTQITNTPLTVTNAAPFISDSGLCVTFESSGDLNTNDGSDSAKPSPGFSNTDGSTEAFAYEVENNNDIGVGTITQISNGPAGTTSSHTAAGGYIFPRQCRTMTYQSDHDQLSSGATGTHVYTFTRSSALIEPAVPASSSGLNLNPSMSAASRIARGPFVVFQSDADLTGNGSSGFEIFKYRAFHNKLRQYSFTETGDSMRPVISDGGGLLAFESTAELLDPAKNKGGPFNPDGNKEIFRMKGRRKIQQLTQSTGCENTNPSIHGYRGRAVAFRSTCDLVPGANPAGVAQVFSYADVKKTDPSLGACTLGSRCCTEATCYPKIIGKMKRVPRPQGLRIR